MQSELTAVLDPEDEANSTRDSYGLDDPSTAEFGRKCILARRLVEAGVRGGMSQGVGEQ